jgi:hypothetical protein
LRFAVRGVRRDGDCDRPARPDEPTGRVIRLGKPQVEDGVVGVLRDLLCQRRKVSGRERRGPGTGSASEAQAGEQ